MVLIKTETESHDLRSKCVPTISVLISTNEECPTPCQYVAQSLKFDGVHLHKQLWKVMPWRAHGSLTNRHRKNVGLERSCFLRLFRGYLHQGLWPLLALLA